MATLALNPKFDNDSEALYSSPSSREPALIGGSLSASPLLGSDRFSGRCRVRSQRVEYGNDSRDLNPTTFVRCELGLTLEPK